MSQVRSATVEDARAIAALHIASWRATYRGHMPDAMLDGLDLEARTAQRARSLEAATHDRRGNIVSCSEGIVRAWASWGPERGAFPEHANRYELYAIYAHPDHVGHGHGRALMDHVVEASRAAGAKTLAVWVLDGNVKAIRFYTRAGFAHDRRIESTPCVMSDGTDTGTTKGRMVRAL